MADKYFQTIGRRKTAVAQVRLHPGGKGSFKINGRELSEYLKTENLRRAVKAPLQEVGRTDSVDVTVRVVGGGQTGQAEAIRMGLARALVKEDETTKTSLKTRGWLTRDARKKERKKFGLRGARRTKQWRKR